MASIIKRGKKYRALIRKKGVTRCQTFETKTAAKTWATSIEAELDRASTGVRLPAKGWTIGDLIDRYIDDIKPRKQWGISKESALKTLKSRLGDRPASSYGVEMVLSHADERLRDGIKTSALKSELSYLGACAKYARNTLRLDLPRNAVTEARGILSDDGKLPPVKRRERRPTDEELATLRECFDHRLGRKMPMNDIIDFAIYSAMRRGEITNIRWDDIDEEKRTVVIRDRKHPQKKLGNDQTVPLLGEAFTIVMRQPKGNDPRIFPYDSQAVGDAFRNACKQLGIDGLHFHDLRHHALSLLFEQGYQIQEVAVVSGHSSWEMLKRYTHIKPESLHR